MRDVVWIILFILAFAYVSNDDFHDAVKTEHIGY